MQLLVNLSLLGYVVMVTLVGARMLLLARRTRGLPELLIGAGSILICGVGFPLSAASGFGGALAQLNAPLWVVSEFITQVGVVLMYGFTQQVFRPGVAWAKALIRAVSLALPIGLTGAAFALASAPADASSVIVTRPWLLLCFVAYAGCFVWTAAESLHHYQMARRRQVLGLADAVVVSRFGLWSFYAVAATGIMAANATGVLLGHNISTSPVVLVPSGVLGFLASIAMYLVFFPPARFLAWLQAPARA